MSAARRSGWRRGAVRRPGTAGSGIRIRWLVLIFVAWLPARLSAAPAESNVVPRFRVDAAGLRNTNGVVRFALFTTADGFPDADRKARFTATAPATGACVSALFPRVPEGVYAVAALHDENRNGRMDRRFPGLPREGFAVSGSGERVIRAAPRFHDATILIRAASTNLSLRIRYY